MFSAAPHTSIPQMSGAAIATDVFVVSEDEPGYWRVADRANDVIFGPFSSQSAALGVAFEGVHLSRRWEIHVLDQFGTLMNTYNSDHDATHVTMHHVKVV